MGGKKRGLRNSQGGSPSTSMTPPSKRPSQDTDGSEDEASDEELNAKDLATFNRVLKNHLKHPEVIKVLEATFKEIFLASPGLKEALTQSVADELRATAAFNTEYATEADRRFAARAQVIDQRLDELQLQQTRQFDALEQYGRRNSIRVFGVPEVGIDTHEDTTPKMAQLLSTKLNIPVHVNDIDVSHRIGRQGLNGKPRAVIVKFVRRELRNAVLVQRRALKNSGVSIAPDLTRQRVKLLKFAQDRLGNNNVWATFSGDIVALCSDNVRRTLSLDSLAKNVLTFQPATHDA
jgi:hypothetical protein